MSLPADDVTLLVVDDVLENLVALEALLRDDGVRVVCARSGDEALELLLRHDVALALVDVQMPGMDGFELAELMRGSARTRHVPIAFMTAGARDRERMFQGYEQGAVDFLYKPVDPHVLRSKVGVFIELHRQRRLVARELEARSETLRLLETFMAILGHDLRTPLSAMLMAASLLEESDDDVARRAAGRVISSGTRMDRMIRDLLDLARGRLAGGIPVLRTKQDGLALVERAAAEVRAARPDVDLRVHSYGSFDGEWDPERMIQIFTNLFVNAVTHGKGDVDVDVNGEASDCFCVSVKNVGDVPESVRARLFDPFRRDGARSRAEGLGLGLYIVERLVTGHGGAIHVKTGDGSTTFTLTFPRWMPRANGTDVVAVT